MRSNLSVAVPCSGGWVSKHYVTMFTCTEPVTFRLRDNRANHQTITTAYMKSTTVIYFALFQTGGGVSENVLHSFCWMYSTFNVPLDFKGVCSKKKSLDVSDPLYNSYYQWVPLYLVRLTPRDSSTTVILSLWVLTYTEDELFKDIPGKARFLFIFFPNVVP